MFKLIKILSFSLLTVIVLVIALGTIFAYTFDANDYKQQIISYVEEQSNRSVEIATLDLSLLPSISLIATELKVGENPDFGTTPFLEAQEIQLGLSILPLLRQEAQVDGIILKDIKLNILRNTSGQFNFDDLQALASAEPKTDSEDVADGASQALALTSFGGITLKDSHVLWDDQSNGTRIEAKNLNFESGSISPNKPAPISLNTDINLQAAGTKDITAAVALDANLLPDLTTGDVAISDINMRTQMAQAGSPLTARVNAQVAALAFKDGALASDAIPIELDASANGLSEDIKALSASIKMKTQLLLDTKGAIQLKDLSTYALLKGLDKDLNVQLMAKDNKALLAGDFVADRFKVAYGEEIQVEGSGRFNNLYENPQAEIKIPVLNYDALQLKQVSLKGSKVGEQVALNLQQAGFQQGRISGKADVNLTNNAYQLQLQANGIPIDKLQAALSADKKATVRGLAKIKLALKGTAGDVDQILQSSNGKVDVHILDGGLRNKAFASIIETVMAFLEGRSQRTAADELIFGDAQATVLLNNGIVKNNDLVVKMPLLSMNGAGEVDLIRSKINYTLHAGLKSMGQVPIYITGNLDSPNYETDFSRLIKQQTEKVKKKVEDIGETIKDKLEGLKDKLKLPF